MKIPGYALLDSGNGQRLEQFGDKTLVRPSTLCLWKPRQAKALWDKAQASYNHDKGWKFNGPRFEEWTFGSSSFQLRLRTQDNGQVGFFPEHATYMPQVEQLVKSYTKTLGRAPRVLNLFAYTGMASVVCLKAGAHVTHVDLAKKALDWASANFELNAIPASSLRLIREDAADFVHREIRRDKKYDLIISDPPSFSRIAANKTWQLDDVIVPMLEATTKLLESNMSALFFTCHHAELSGPIAANLLLDLTSGMKAEIANTPLAIPEADSPRSLPAGSLVTCRIG
ncbi:MAG: class I SAM-dependent methyltransferase [Deltaproteobacteria bacterium]|nr:class I SAM-dependent methyltransferase [Deltaproteobacteria bacterium]